MNGKMKKNLSMLLVAIMIMGLIPVPSSATVVAPNSGMEMRDIGATPANSLPSSLTDGGIWTDKTVTSAGGGEFDVTLRALGQEYKVAQPLAKDQLDVVFVLDNSTSMGSGVGSKLDNMKTAAKAAVGTILGAAGNRVALVTYNSNATSYGGIFVTTSTGINTAISGLNATGSTNIQAAFFMAQKVFAARGEDITRKPVIILMSDGSPTYYYDSIQTTTNNTTRLGTGSSTTGAGVWNTVKQAMYTKGQVTNLKIYTIGFGVGGDPYAVATLMPTSDNTDTYRTILSTTYSGNTRNATQTGQFQYQRTSSDAGDHWSNWSLSTLGSDGYVAPSGNPSGIWTTFAGVTVQPQDTWNLPVTSGGITDTSYTDNKGDKRRQIGYFLGTRTGIEYDAVISITTRESFAHTYWEPESSVTNTSAAQDISNAFVQIINELINFKPMSYTLDTEGNKVYSSVKIDDVLGAGFDVVGALPTGITRVGDTLTWTLTPDTFKTMEPGKTSVDLDKLNTVTFRVKLKSNLGEGTYETNASAKGYFTVASGNPAYKNETNKYREQPLTHKGWLTLFAPPVEATLTLTKTVSGPVTNVDRTFDFALYSDQACTSFLTTAAIGITVNGADSVDHPINISLPASYFINGSATVYAKELTVDPADPYWNYDNNGAKTLIIDKATKSGSATFTNVYAPKGTLTVEKSWVGSDYTTSVAFKLKEKVNDTWQDVGQAYTLSQPDWKATINNLDLDKEYRVEEVLVPQDYLATYNDETVTFTGENLSDTITITNTYQEPQGIITVKKTWNDNDNQEEFRPTSVVFDYTGPTSGSIVLSQNQDGNWATDFYTSDFGTYTFTEVVPQDYTATATEQAVTITKEAISDRTNTLSFENSFVPPSGTVTVKKEWKQDDNDTTFRPSQIWMKLFKKVVGTESTSDASVQVGGDFELNAGNSWTKAFKELIFGEYSVEEISVNDYTTSYSALSVVISKGILGDITARTNGITVFNTFKNPKGEITVNKVWIESGMNPEESSISEILVTLQGGGTSSQVTLSAINDWTHTFEDLPLTVDGTIYTVTEAATNDVDQAKLAKYTQDISYGGNGGSQNGITINHDKRDGTATIKNTYAKGTITVTKDWVDRDNPALEQPSVATISLYKDTKYIETITEAGIGENQEPIIITTTKEAIQTDLIETRTLDRSTSPASLTTVFYDLTLDSDSTYYVEEASIPYYSTQYSSNGVIIKNGIVINEENKNGSITVTNTYDDPKGSLTVTKEWNHKNNPNKPTQVTVTLYKDGQIYDIKSAMTGTAIFENLDLNSTYTLSEGAVPNYLASGYNDFEYVPTKGETTVNQGNVTITNTYIPEVGSLNIVKKWEGTTGSGITATITRYDAGVLDGSFKNPSYVLDESNNWQHEFTGLELYGPGGLYSYHVQETGDDLALYDAAITDPQQLEAGKMATITITNKYAPNRGTLTISKVWAPLDGETVVPATTSVSIVLVKNNVAEKMAMVLSEENNWTATRSGLDAGKSNVYTVRELNTFEDFNISYSDNITFTPGDLSQTITVTNQKNAADISILVQKEASRDTAFLTDGKATFDYMIHITNTGNRTLNNISIEDLMTASDGAIGAQILYSVTSGAFENLGSLAPKASMNFAYSVTVDKSGLYDNTATVTGRYGDATASDVATASTLVKNPGLSIVKDVVGPSTITGTSGTFTYLLTIRNDGEVDLQDVVIQDVMGLVTGSTANYTYAGSNFDPATKTFTIGEMPSKSTDVAITYTVTLDQPGTYTNTATVTGDYITDYIGESETPVITTIHDSDDATVSIVTPTTPPDRPKKPSDPVVPIEDPEVPLVDLPAAIIPEDETPLTDMPNTGGIPAIMLFGLGAFLAGGGALLRRKEKTEK